MKKSLQYLARVMTWGFTVLIFSVTLYAADAAGGVDLDTGLEFRDTRQPNAKYSDRGKAWEPAEQEQVMEDFEFINEKAPGLMERVTAYRPVRLYRPQGVIYVGGSAFNDQIDNAILLPDEYFELDASKARHGLIHELAHLADGGNKVAHSPEWAALVESKIKRISAGLKEQGLAHHQPAGRRLEEEIALEEGLPSGYAGSSLYEALAECTAQVVVSDDPAMDLSIQEFVQSTMLAPDFTPDESVRHQQEGLEKIQKKDAIGALRALDKALVLDPEFAQAHRERATAFELIHAKTKSVEALSSAIELWPKTLVTAMLRDRGEAWVELGELDNAIEDFSLAIEYAPGDTWAYFFRGKTYASKEDWDSAIEDLSISVQLAPGKFPSAHLERGLAYKAQGEFSLAIEDFTKAVDIGSRYADAYFQRARTFVEMGDYDEAIADFEKTKEVDPSTADLVDPWIAEVKRLQAE